MKLLKKLVNWLNIAKAAREDYRRNTLLLEAEVGGKIFGPVPEGVERSFFCLDRTTWVWQEKWTDQAGQSQTLFTRFDILPDTIIKTQNGVRMQMTIPEMQNFVQALHEYNKAITAEIYYPQTA